MDRPLTQRGGTPGTDGLAPGDGLLVVEPGGITLWSPRVKEPEKGFKLPWKKRAMVMARDPEPTVVERGTPLLVVEGDPGTVGVCVRTPTGILTVVTDMDVRTGAVEVLSRKGLTR